jgi:hypothetical protein
VKVPKPSGKGQYDDHFPSARWLADYRLDWLPSDAVADATAMQASAIDKRLGILAYGGQPISAIRSRAKLKMIEKADAKEAPLRGGGAFLRAGHGNVVPSDERREFITLLGGAAAVVARSGACAAAGDEFLMSPGRNDGANLARAFRRGLTE